jgi:hypothetical protein
LTAAKVGAVNTANTTAAENDLSVAVINMLSSWPEVGTRLTAAGARLFRRTIVKTGNGDGFHILPGCTGVPGR